MDAESCTATRRNRDTGHYRYNVAGLTVIIASALCLQNEFILARLYLYSGKGRTSSGSPKGMGSMGMSDPEARKKLSEARWLQFKHQAEKQTWPWWKRLIHRFRSCPICKPDKLKTQ